MRLKGVGRVLSDATVGMGERKSRKNASYTYPVSESILRDVALFLREFQDELH